ncbi:MAG: ATP-binding protein [Thermoleophilia bacterium]
MRTPILPGRPGPAALLRAGLTALALGGVGALLVQGTTGVGGDELRQLFADTIYNALLGIAVVVTLARALARGDDAVAWFFLAAAVVCGYTGDLIYSFGYPDEPPFPGLPDVFYVLYYPLGAIGIALLARTHLTGIRAGLWLDGAAAGLSVGALGAAILAHVEITSGGALADVVSLAYPVCDLVMLVLIASIVVAADWRPGRRWFLIALGLGGLATADVFYLFQSAADTYVEGGLLDAVWPVSYLLVAGAAWAPRPAPKQVRERGRSQLLAPALWGAITATVLAWTKASDSTFWVAVGLAVLALVAVFLRAALAIAENQQLVEEVRRELADRQRAERERDSARAEAEARIRGLIEHLSELVTVVDRDLAIAYEAGAVEATLGARPGAHVGRSVLDLVHPDDRGAVRESLLGLAETGGSLAVEARLRHAAGEWRVVEAIATNLLAVPGVEGIVLNARDVSERREAQEALRASEEQLRQAQKLEAVGRLAGGIAHDFNNLLAAILGYTSLAIEMLPEDSDVLEELAEVERAATRAASLTRQLLAYSRKQLLQPRTLDMNAVVIDVDRMLRRLIGEDIRVAAALDPDLGLVKADPGQVEQVLLNLAINARDAMPEGGRLTIETANVELGSDYADGHFDVAPGRYVMVAVSDTGTGMPPDVVERIFEPFFTTKPDGKGTGLGLATVQGIVRQSDGHVWVYSEPGEGTTFKVYLPRVDDPGDEREEQEMGEAVTGTGRVLVVEDEDAVRRMIRKTLERYGYEVIEAGSPDEALEVARGLDQPVDLLLTDVVRPGASGRWLAERMREERPGLAVLFLSGYTDDAVVRHGVLEAEVEFLQKPFAPAVLAARVRDVIAGRRAA